MFSHSINFYRCIYIYLPLVLHALFQAGIINRKEITLQFILFYIFYLFLVYFSSLSLWLGTLLVYVCVYVCLCICMCVNKSLWVPLNFSRFLRGPGCQLTGPLSPINVIPPPYITQFLTLFSQNYIIYYHTDHFHHYIVSPSNHQYH